MRIPTNAGEIILARKRGFKPADLILVSLVGRIDELNHTVYANPENDYEWLWAAQIKICIFAQSGIDWQRTARSVASQRPSYLCLWDVNRQEGADIHYLPHFDDIEKPKSKWRWELDFLTWTPYQNQEFSSCS